MMDAAIFSMQIKNCPLLFVALAINRKEIGIARLAVDLSEVSDPLLLEIVSHIDNAILDSIPYEMQSFVELFSRKKRQESIKKQATNHIVTLITEFADEILDKDINDLVKYTKNYK